MRTPLFINTSRQFMRAFTLVVALQPLVHAQTVSAIVATGANPLAVGVNAVTNKAYVANEGGSTVTVIDGASNATATVAAGTNPFAVAVNAVTNKIYVANSSYSNQSNPGTVTVIDGASNSTTTVPVGIGPLSLAVNSATNKIYVANSGFGFTNPGTVTVIDGATTSTTTIPAGIYPFAVAVNSVTNKIYVVNHASASVTVIDGAANTTSTVATGGYPASVAVNESTNKIYVTNEHDDTVTVIDGATNNTTNVSTGSYPDYVAVNAVTNQIYVANFNGQNVTVIDGATNNTTTVAASVNPAWIGVNQTTNKIFVANYGSANMTVIDGATNNTVTISAGQLPLSAAINPTTNKVYVCNTSNNGAGSNTVTVIDGGTALQFVPVTPCRVADTRLANGPFGGPVLSAGVERDFLIPNSPCGIPTNAVAYSLNVTAVPAGGLGYLSIWPSGLPQPLVSTLNSDSRVKANAAIVPAGASGGVAVYVSDASHVILDINGYFVAGNLSALDFYPVTPCRIADTRLAKGPFGGPFLSAGVARSFSILSSSCNIPSTAQAYSLNFTAVPQTGLGFLSTWPTGQSQPVVSTLNASNGHVTANAAIVPAGISGAVNVYASDNSDVVIDINGYFAPPAAGGLSLYNVTPCRIIDTRNSSGQFTGTITTNVTASSCGVSQSAQAYVLNATVVPPGGLGFLTLWPTGQSQPPVSTLNSDGSVTSNMAIVPNLSGSANSYASDATQLILDISGYFAP